MIVRRTEKTTKIVGEHEHVILSKYSIIGDITLSTNSDYYIFTNTPVGKQLLMATFVNYNSWNDSMSATVLGRVEYEGLTYQAIIKSFKSKDKISVVGLTDAGEKMERTIVDELYPYRLLVENVIVGQYENQEIAIFEGKKYLMKKFVDGYTHSLDKQTDLKNLVECMKQYLDSNMNCISVLQVSESGDV